jgi:diguanylate cyclase (GGDEF)-like protein
MSADVEIPVSLVVLDVDHFATVNATLGHASGDDLLRQIADRLLSHRPDGSFLARTGGNTYALAVHGEDAGRAPTAALAARLLGCLRDPFELDQRTLRVSASAGVALPLEMDADSVLVVDDLHRRADLALAQAKETARGHYDVWEPQLSLRNALKLDAQQQLRLALAGPSGLTMHYQPFVDVRTRRVTGVEALVRGSGPEIASGAADIVAAAADTGLLAALDGRVLDLVRSDLPLLLGWPDTESMRVHVNVSAAGLIDPGWLCRLGIGQEVVVADDSARLCIEVTEHALVETGSAGSRHLVALREAGHLVVLDDFGAGFTSLATLASLPADIVKLDRSLLFDVDCDRRRRAVLSGAVTLAHDLGLRVVAEGVEREEQHAVLIELGCDEAQGWLHSEATRPPVAA